MINLINLSLKFFFKSFAKSKFIFLEYIILPLLISIKTKKLSSSTVKIVFPEILEKYLI